MKSLLARWIFVSLGCMACISGIAGQSSPPATQATTQPGVGTLPEAWFGTWRGPAESVAPGGQIGGRYVMGLQIGASAEQAGATSPVYDWAITYEQGDQRQTRPYLLRVAASESGQAQPGHFILDERNGVFVDQFLVGDVMEGHFIATSPGRRTILHSRYELTKDDQGRPAIRVEIATYAGDEARASDVGENRVESRRLIRVQRALLTRA